MARKQGSAALDPEPKTAQIAGIDYCALNDDDSDDNLRDDYLPGLIVENAPGGPYGSGQ